MTFDARGTFRTSLAGLFGVVEPVVIDEVVDRMTVVEVAAGTVLYRRGEPGDGMHVLHSGRLQVRVPDEESGRERLVSVIGRGGVVGEIALFTGASRIATVVAVRDSTLGFLSREAFDTAMASHPAAQLYIARFIIDRLIESYGGARPGAVMRTFAILALDDGVDGAGFARRLQHAMLRFGRTALVESRAAHHRFPSLGAAARSIDAGEVGYYLDELEDRYDFVLLEGDGGPTRWAHKCAAYADVVLLVASADSPVESAAARVRAIGATGGGVARELVLLHARERALPNDTRRWLDAIPVDRHHHVPRGSDAAFGRLGRHYSGNSVAVVFGGGGARGFAHIGVIRALREAGVPIDTVGGTSLGAIVAGGVSMGWDDGRMLEEYKGAFVDVNPANDYTLPVYSMLRGEKMSRGLRRHFGDARIEDLWIPFFAVSSNLTRGAEYVHRSGPLWRALRASASLPAIFPPMVEGENVLVDGGLLNNLPLSVVRDVVNGFVIVVDVSLEEEEKGAHVELPSVWRYLRQRVLEPESVKSLPTIERVAIKSTLLGSRREDELARRNADLFMCPPTQQFDLLDWSRMLDICDVGYSSVREQVSDWAAAHADLIRHEGFLDTYRHRVP